MINACRYSSTLSTTEMEFQQAVKPFNALVVPDMVLLTKHLKDPRKSIATHIQLGNMPYCGYTLNIQIPYEPKTNSN